MWSGKILRQQNPNKSKQNLLISTEIRRFLALHYEIAISANRCGATGSRFTHRFKGK